MVTRPCNECQAPYEAEQRYLNRGQGLFCSRRCASDYNGRQKRVVHEPNIECAWCGIKFYRQVSHQNSKSGLYFCSSDHQNLAYADPNHPVSAGLSRTKPICKCGKLYRGNLGMCRSCYTQYQIEQWLDGNIEITLSQGSNKETKRFVKRYLIETRGDRCEICGFDEKAPDGRSIIQMDHINGDCFDNRPENLQLLCPNHHAMTPTYGSLNRGSGRAHRRKASV